MLPTVVDNSYDFGCTDAELFGHKIPIACSVCVQCVDSCELWTERELISQIGDQSASMWGSCCFNKGDIKVTLGTGSFLNLNTSSQCNASIYGLYPLVAWKCGDDKNKEVTYCMEGASNDTGSIIQWATHFGKFLYEPRKCVEC